MSSSGVPSETRGGQPCVTLSSLLPARRLQNKQVRDLLRSSLILPALRSNHLCLSLRMVWEKLPDQDVDHVWCNLPSFRQHLDMILAKCMGVRYIVSAITATQSTKSAKEGGTRYKINPGLAYWVVGNAGVLKEPEIYCGLRKNPYRAQLKHLLYPIETRVDLVENALFTVVKDNVDGVVMRTLGMNAQLGEDLTLVKIICCEKEEKDRLENLVESLEVVNFRVVLSCEQR